MTLAISKRTKDQRGGKEQVAELGNRVGLVKTKREKQYGLQRHEKRKEQGDGESGSKRSYLRKQRKKRK